MHTLCESFYEEQICGSKHDKKLYASKMFETLVAHGADINAVDNAGNKATLVKK